MHFLLLLLFFLSVDQTAFLSPLPFVLLVLLDAKLLIAWALEYIEIRLTETHIIEQSFLRCSPQVSTLFHFDQWKGCHLLSHSSLVLDPLDLHLFFVGPAGQWGGEES